jgi:hypothetical protein
MTTSNQTIEIPLNKSKLIFGIIASIVFVLLGVWMIISAPNGDSSTIFKIPVLKFIIGLICVVCFSFILIITLRNLINNKLAFTINREGIIDNSSNFSVGFVSWKEIEHIQPSQIGLHKILLIMVSNPNDYINRAPNKLIQRAMRSNLVRYNTPIIISNTILKIDLATLQQTLLQKLFEYRQQHS